MDYKQQIINQIMINSMDVLSQEQQSKLSDVISIILHDYDICIKEKEEYQLPATIEDLNQKIVDRYLLSKAVAALSKRSLNLYKLKLTIFITSINKKVTDIVSDDITYYLAIRKTRGNLSNTTLDNERLVLSSFFSWLHDEEYIKKNPMKSIKRIKNDTMKEDPFTQTEIEILISHINNNRDRAIMEFILSTGCRVEEVYSVNRNQIDFYTKQLKIVGKGTKERVVFLSDKCVYYLKKYLNERKDFNDALFVSRKDPYNRLSIGGIQAMFRALGNKSGIDNVHPHRFRRTLCNILIDRGMPLQDAQEVMGHSNPQTTLIYYNNKSANIHNKFNNLI